MGSTTKINKNTFEQGIIKDLNSTKLPNSAIRDSQNIEYMEHEEFLSPTNIRGTENVEALTSGTYPGQIKVLRTEDVSLYMEDSEQFVPGSVLFVAHRNGAASNDQLLIFFFAKEGATTYYLDNVYVKTVEGIYDESVDSVKFGENGYDYVYFTVVGGFLGKIKCSWNEVSPVVIEDKDIILQKKGCQSTVALNTITEDTGASLFNGTYMFAVRLVDNNTDSYTKWSLLTWPIQITPELNASTFSEGVIGQSSSKKIQLDIEVEAGAVTATGYTHYQIAVIENIDGTTIPAALAYVQDMEPLTTSQTSYVYDYKANSTKNQVDVTEIVTDYAQIRWFNTVNIKDNILFGGGVTYKNLDYDNGDPVVGSVTYLLENSSVIPDSFRDDAFSSTHRGYFRGEVYRFYASYYDEDYNFSFPKVLNFYGVSGAISSDGIDLKFPDRFNTSYGHIAGSGEETYSLGVRFTDISNHPSWAVGMVILRAKRIKNVLGQAAVVPTIKVEPPFQWHGYPEYPNEDYPSGTGDDTIEPPDPLGIYVPKIFGGYIAKDIRRGNRVSGKLKLSPEYMSHNGTSINPDKITDSTRQLLLFSPEYLYTSAGNALGNVGDLDGAYITPVDAVLLQGDKTNGENNDEGLLNHSSASTFYGYTSEAYFNAEGRASGRNALLNRGTQKLREAYLVPEGSSAVTSLGRYGDHDSMKISGYSDGYVPVTQKAVVAVVDDPRLDIAYESLDAAVSNSQWVGSNTYAYGPSATNNITSANVNFDTNQFNATTDASAIEVVNIVRNIGDNRYGNEKKQHEALFTGAEHKLASVGAATPITIDVWGGDCYIGKFNFKTTDRNYALVNPTYDHDLQNATEKDAAKDDWGTWFATDWTNTPATTYDQNQPRPIGVNALAETISIYIESEINTSIDYKDTYRVADSTSVSDDALANNAYTGNSGGGFETWLSWTPGTIPNFTSGSDIVVTGSPFGQFNNVSCVTTYTATSALTNASIAISGTVTWGDPGVTGLSQARLWVEKVDSGNNYVSNLIDDNQVIPGFPSSYVHNVNSLANFSLAIGEKLRIVYKVTVSGGAAYPILSSGSLTFGISTTSSVIGPSQEFEFLVPFSYRYNGGYSVENESRTFVTEPEGYKARTSFRSRVHYSNQKLYQTSETGFDTWPVGNFYDLDETFGKVTKLARVKNNMYALMANGLLHLPINANVMQTADGQSLSIRSADVIGTPQVQTAEGCNSIQATVNKYDKLIYVNSEIANIMMLDDNGLNSISDDRMTSFFHENLSDDVMLHYDTVHKKLVVSQGTDFNYVYNTKYNIWETNRGLLQAGSYELNGIVNLDKKTYLLGVNDSDTNRMRIDLDYSDAVGMQEWFGVVAPASLTYKMNADSDFPKTIDALSIDADEGLDSIQIDTNGMLGPMSTGIVSLIGTNIDGVYKVKKYRNIIEKFGKTGQRIRGNTASITVNWHDEFKATLESILTKYRLSKRVI